jgi:hemerythrin-like domain-containing protein
MSSPETIGVTRASQHWNGGPPWVDRMSIDEHFCGWAVSRVADCWCRLGQSLRNGDGGRGAEHEEEDVAPPEALMREHGVLKRVLLVYEEAIRRIDAKQDLSPDAVRNGAGIIRTFIEDYHEKLEEDYLFPRFEKARRLTELTLVLRAQHQAGRRVTEQITRLATAQTLKEQHAAITLRDAMHQFVRMYGPHELREDTVLFPALRAIV